MPVNITDVSTFTDPIVAPADADPADRTYVVTIAQGLSNRTRKLWDMVGGAPGDKTIYIGPTCARYHSSWVQGIFAYAQSGANDAALHVDLADFLPSGAVLKEVHALVKPGAARAGGDRMLMKVFRQDLTAFPGADPTLTQLGVDQEDGGGNTRQLISQAGLTETIDRDVNAVTLQLQAGNTGGTGGQEDRFYALKIVFTDPGPRSF